jgi:putative transposase
MDDFRAGRHVVHRLHAHLVFTTKYRRGAIHTNRVRMLLKEVMTSVAADMDATVEAVEADGDHVHLLVNYPPQLALSTLVNGLKGVSSRRLRQKDWPEVTRVLWGTAFWSPSYCVVSCGGAPLDIIKTYVETQDAPDRDRRGAAQRARRKEEKKRRGQTEP